MTAPAKPGGRDEDEVARAEDARSTPASDAKGKLLALADRCEREEPTWALDCDIAEAIGWYRPHPDLRRPKILTPKYTTSLDAAVTLVPEGWVWVLDCCAYPRPAAFVVGDPEDATNNDPDAMADSQTVTTKTPALALCAAALRARAYLSLPHGDNT